MRPISVFRAFVLLALLAAPAAYAEADVSDGDCWATFALLGQAAAKTPAAKAVMDNGAAAASGAIRRTVPDASTEELGLILKIYVGDLGTALKDKSLTQQQLLERANACEAQYSLPVTDFAKFQAPAKAE